MPIREITGVNDGGDLFPDNTNSATSNTNTDNTNVNVSATHISKRTITDEEIETLSHFKYDEEQDQLIGDRAIETTLNSIFLGEQHKMSSGAENIFFTNLSTNTNYYSMKGGLKDQSLTANQGASGFLPPTGRVYSDMFSIPLGGDVSLNTIGYSGPNYFGVNIAGLGITTTAGEEVGTGLSLEYTLQVNGVKVYKQILDRETAVTRTDKTIYSGDLIEWFFDHPVEILAGTTIFAEIRKVDRVNDIDYGVFQVRQGDVLQSDGNYRYQAIVHNRLFEDKDLELISPYLKYKALDFKLDATGSTILLRDLSLGADNVLVPHAVNTLQAVANGTEIQIKIKDGAKILIESLPVSGVSIDGSFVNSVMNLAVAQLNALFTNSLGFISPDSFVNSFTLSGNDLTLGLNDGISYSVDVTSLGVDENNFVASGALSGSDLTLTMADATEVVIDASSLAVDENTTITFGTLANNLLTLNASDSSTITIDVSALSVDENLYVESGVLNGNDIELTMSDASVVVVGVGSLAIDNNTTISSGVVSGTDIVLSLSDASIINIDASTLSTGSSNEVVSGSVVGNNLVLVMSDATEITIDAANMINGASLTAVNDEWFISYGANANIAVGQSIANNTQIGGVALNFQGPYYYGTQLVRGSEFKFNFQHSGGYNFIFGIWDGLEEATQYGSSNTYLGQLATSNWSTGFRYQGGFLSSNNTSLTNTRNNGSKYVLDNGMPLVLRFGLDGHLTLFDVTDSANEVEILKTQSALAVASFNVQMGVWANGQFFNTIISESGWEVVHDFDGSENGIFDGIKDHTIIRSLVQVDAGEKFMFDLDRLGSGEFFGTLYSGAASGNSTAETQLTNSFEYRTNEAVTLSSSWTANTAAVNYFLAGGGVASWRVGGSNNKQGVFSIRYQSNNTIELWSETENELVATSLYAADGNSIGFYMGSDEEMTYAEIPVVTKQLITQGTQPNAQFKPTIANQTISVIEGEVLNYTIVDTDNIVNQYVEVDAPSWVTMNQNSGVLSGTAPAFAGTAADTIVVNCKAGNAIGGTIDFTITITIASYASTNTKSLDFGSSSASLQGPHANVTALQRGAANGTGAGDAWTISMWVKPSAASNTQTLFYYGGDDLVNEGRIEITQFGGANLLFKYGSTNDNVTIFGVNVLPVNQWNHIMVSYDGVATTNTSTDIALYVTDRFTVNVNGSQGWNSFQHVNYGYTGSIIADKFRVGRLLGATTSQYMLGGRINQIGIWGTDERANLATIYNGGSTQDLSLLTSAPEHYYEIENSITTIDDKIGNAPLTGYNFVASDLVTDTP